MSCPDCTTAAAARYHGIYRAGCFGCEMRGFARSTLAFDAVQYRTTTALREALAKSHPGVPIEVALAEVWRWWRMDHPTTTEGTTA